MVPNYSMIIATLFFVGSFIAGKFAIEEFPVLSLTFFRFSIATLVLFGVLKYRKINLRLSKKEIPKVVALSLFGILGYHILFFTALKYTSSINTSLILALNPIITIFISILFLKYKATKKEFFGIFLSLTGTIMIITNGSLEFFKTLSINKGDLYMVGAVFAMAIYLIMLKDIVKTIEPLKVTTYVFLITTILLIPGTIYEISKNYLIMTTPKGWGSMLYMSIFASIISYFLQQISIKKVGPIETSLYMNLVPLFTVILAYLILGEQISIQKAISGLMIIMGVFITSNKGSLRPSKVDKGYGLPKI